MFSVPDRTRPPPKWTSGALEAIKHVMDQTLFERSREVQGMQLREMTRAQNKEYMSPYFVRRAVEWTSSRIRHILDEREREREREQERVQQRERTRTYHHPQHRGELEELLRSIQVLSNGVSRNPQSGQGMRDEAIRIMQRATNIAGTPPPSSSSYNSNILHEEGDGEDEEEEFSDQTGRTSESSQPRSVQLPNSLQIPFNLDMTRGRFRRDRPSSSVAAIPLRFILGSQLRPEQPPSTQRGMDQEDQDTIRERSFPYREIREEDSEGTSEHQCYICMEHFGDSDQVIRLDCGHIFHENEIMRWFSGNTTCPVCRGPASRNPPQARDHVDNADRPSDSGGDQERRETLTPGQHNETWFFEGDGQSTVISFMGDGGEINDLLNNVVQSVQDSSYRNPSAGERMNEIHRSSVEREEEKE